MTGRARLADLGVSIGAFPRGPENAITDVAGVRIGHVTKIAGHGPLVRGEGPVRTGVTAVLPAEGDLFLSRVFAGCHTINGAGELMGLAQLEEWGLCETPLLLTNTLAVGRVADAAVTWITTKNPRIGRDVDVVLPIVGECDDSYINDSVGRHITEGDVFAALDGARSGPVEEGTVGAGAGMQTFDFAGGIGTSSRRLSIAGAEATVGTLVLSNFGARDRLRIDGVPVGRLLAEGLAHLPRRPAAGSIVILIATDVPLYPGQLSRLSRRATLALGRVGGYAANNSGEFAVAWSTANRIPREHETRRHRVELVLDHELDPLYEATIDAVEEAILNAIVAGVATYAHSGHGVPALPLEETRQALARYRVGGAG